METTTKQITENLHKEIENKLNPLAKDLMDAGWSKRRIEGILRKCIKRETDKFYNSRGFESIGSIVNQFVVGQSADSRAEVIFYELLLENNIKFEFQYQIGPYRVDYLIWDILVVELDGPHHERQIKVDAKRDLYLKRLGFQVMRIPLNYVVLDSSAVIKSIKEFKDMP